MGLIAEMLLILLVALFFVGHDKIPEIARSLGKATGEFKKAQNQTENEFKTPGEPLSEKDSKIHKLVIEMDKYIKNKKSEQLIEEISSKIRSNDTNQVKST